MTTLDTAACPPRPATTRGTFSRFGRWLDDGWRLFRKAPVRLFGALLFLFAVEGVIQLTVPVVGIVLSKWVVGLLGGVIWLMLANLDSDGRLRPLASLGQVRGRWLALSVLSVVQMAGFGAQLLVGWFAFGRPGLEMLLLAKPMPVPAIQLGLIMAVAIAVNMLLVFTTPRLLLDRESLGRALAGGLAAARRCAGALGLLAFFNALLIALAPVTALLSVLFTGPFILCVGYAAYRDAGRDD